MQGKRHLLSLRTLLYSNVPEAMQRVQRIRKETRPMNEFFLQTYTIALPILLGYIVWILKQQKKDGDANSEGTKMLLMVKLIEYHDKYMALGCIPSHAYDNFQKMYSCYIKMGDGNTSIEKMHQEIEELNLKQKKEGGTRS